jgi:hypothetical protein
MFNFIKRLFSSEDKKGIVNENIINLMEYHYRIDEIYGNMLFVDVDIDTCEVEKGHYIKLFNVLYTLANKEFLPYKKEFRWRLTLIKDED